MAAAGDWEVYNQLMIENQQELTLYSSKRKYLLLLIVSLVLMTGGLAMLRDGEASGWFVSGFFGLCSLVFIITMLPGASYLRLSTEGYEVCSLFRKHTVKWRDIGPLVGTNSGNKMVVFDYSPSYTEHVTSRQLAKKLTGFEGSLHDTFGMSADDLARVMNEWRGEHDV